MVAKNPQPLKRKVLSFRETGRALRSDTIADEFRRMKAALKHVDLATPETFALIIKNSGTHSAKTDNPKAGVHQSVLRVERKYNNSFSELTPFTNAKLIPPSQIVYGPLAIIGSKSKCLVDHFLNPDENSAKVKEVFSEVFGKECLEAIEKALAEGPAPITSLALPDFPIIYVPDPINKGKDLQITPVAPAAAYSIMQRIRAKHAFGININGDKVSKGSWSWQKLSDQPQNISGKITGKRVRFHARFPGDFTRYEREVYRYSNGGAFPHLHNPVLVDRILAYVDLMRSTKKYNDKNMRDHLKSRANTLVREASDFIAAVQKDVKERGADAAELQPATVIEVLLDRQWQEDEFVAAREALNDAHFRDCIRKLGACQ